MTEDIKSNLSFLADHLLNLQSILLRLIETDVISQNESDEIKSKSTNFERNTRLLELIQRKNWATVRDLFLRILRITGNGHCADTIEGIPNRPTHVNRLHSNLLKETWWPEKKRLIESLHPRKIGDKLLVDELHDRLVKDKNRMIVITESSGASKLSGMGGVGKTLTAIWYAHKYENYYEHVVWIDCGEGTVLTSFRKLAQDLKITDLLEVEDFVKKSYQELMQFKCLWVFDNAENYKGPQGIIKVLPKYMNNFFCLITSRSGEWGIENIGYGKISDLQLDIFSEQESIDFFQQNLGKEIKYTEFQLQELCRLLGNLPLAIQLAVSALNVGKIDLKNYIKNTSVEDVVNIVDTEFDDYEKTINAGVKITLDSLAKEKDGIVAKDILLICGYIRPDDIPLDLFEEILKLSKENVKRGVELLEKYSLISKELKTIEWEAKFYVSIHRLLQQVIRHNGRENEKETLRKILACKGFVSFKLLPFAKYANEQLRKELPRVKAELLDQQQLTRLVKGKRFQESVELSKFINKELQKHSTKFNYATCLEKNGQLDDQIKVLEELYKEEMKEEMHYPDYGVIMGILNLDSEMAKELVGGHLLVSHWKMDNKGRLLEILEDRKSFKMIYSQGLMTTLLEILNSIFTDFNYNLTDDKSMFKITLNGDTKRIHLNFYSVDLSIPLPNDLQELILREVLFKHTTTKNETNINDISDWLPKKLNTLEISCLEPKQIILSLGSISSIENIILHECSLNLDFSNRISPRNLRLSGVSHFKNGQKLSNVNINTFLHFHKMNRLEINCSKNDMSMDLSEESASIEYLHLDGVNVVSLKSAKGNGAVSIKEAKIANCLLDLCILPLSLEKLSLSFNSKVFVSGGINLKNLRHLQLKENSASNLTYFRSLQLTHLYFNGVEDINVDILPTDIKIIRIDNRMNRNWVKLIGGGKHLDRLILDGFSLKEVELMMTHFHIKQLVLHNDRYNPIDLIQLMHKQQLTVVIGTIAWGKEDFKNSILSKQVDRKSKYYLLHQGTGKAIDQKHFDDLYKRDSFES